MQAGLVVAASSIQEVDLRGLEMEGRACRDVYEMMSCALDVHVPRPALSDGEADDDRSHSSLTRPQLQRLTCLVLPPYSVV